MSYFIKLLTSATKATEEQAKQCNYDDNYYGDQVCQLKSTD